MKKTILITGGVGYIGSHAVVQFAKMGYNIVIIDNLLNSKIEVLDNIKQIIGYEPDFYKIDLLDKKKLDKVFEKYNFDAVIHFAGLKAVGESCQKPLFYFENNIIGSLNLFKSMKEFNVKNIIFSSSATVYDMFYENDDLFKKIGNDIILKRGLKETDKTGNTTNPYGKTKFLLEEILIDLSNFSGFNVILLRYFNPIGAHPSGLLGEDPNGLPNNLLPYIMKVATNKLEYLKVFGNDYPTSDGTGIRDYIDVNDLVQGHLQAYNLFKKNNKEGFIEIFNLGTGKGTSVLEMINKVKKVSGNDIKYKIVGRREGDLAISYCDPSKAKKVLGFNTNFGIEESINNMLKFYKK